MKGEKSNNEMNFDYIKAQEDEIFKNLPKQGKKQDKVRDPMQLSGYANLEDIMKAQDNLKGGKKK